jgi:NAD(P)H dehydrogenase (quinone)
MAMPTYGISGASGHLGRLVTQELLDRGVSADDLVLITRSPDVLADRQNVRHGDWSSPDTLAEAYAGVDHLLLISGDDLGTRLQGQVAAIDAAKAAGVQRVAYTSAGNPVADNPVAVGPSHRGTEEALQASGLRWIILRNALYAEFQVPDFQGAVATGRLVSNQGEGRTTYVSREDCAAAAAGALLSDADDVVYDITGTELLSAADKAALASELGGTPVELVLVDDDTVIAGLQEHGIPAEGAQVIASFGRAVREGYLDQVSDAVQQLAGRPPRSLRDVVAPALGG